MPYKIQNLIADRPKLHLTWIGEPVDWAVEEPVLRYLQKNLRPQSKTVEIGAGVTTICFALRACRHIAIMPDQTLWDRTVKFMKEHGVDHSTVTYVCSKSQYFLPTFQESDFDLVLIDGDHAFPLPMIDYYYLSKKLKVGGRLIIDNVELWTGDMLKKFLMLEPEWKLDADLPARAVVFQKIKETDLDKSWVSQPYTIINSNFVPQDILDRFMPKFQK